MKPKTFRFFNDTWQFEIVLRIGGTHEDASSHFDRLIDGRPSGSKSWRPGTQIKNYAAVFMSRGEKGVLVWFAEAPDPGVCAHEAIHAVAHVMRESGLGPLNEDTEEAYAYLIQWLVDEIMRRAAAKPGRKTCSSAASDGSSPASS